MSSTLPAPSKEVDVEFLVFIERYATDLLKWDILTLFGHNPQLRATLAEIAAHLGRRALSTRPEVGDLALLGVLEPVTPAGAKTVYQLTGEPNLRRMVIKLANTPHPPGTA